MNWADFAVGFFAGVLALAVASTIFLRWAISQETGE